MTLFLDTHVPVEIGQADRAALLSACGDASSEECVERTPGAAEAPDGIVAWQSAELACVRVWVRAKNAETSYQELCFAAADSLRDRFTATGLMVGALHRKDASEGSPGNGLPAPPVDLREPESAPARATKVRPLAAEGAAREQEKSSKAEVKRLDFLVLGTLETALDLRMGVRAEAAWRPRELWELAVAGTFGADPGEPGRFASEVAEGTLGVGLSFPLGRTVQLRIGAGPLGQWTRVALERVDPASMEGGTSESARRATEEGSTFRWGAEGRAGVRWLLAAGWFVEGRWRGAFLPATPTVFVGGRAVEDLRALEGGGQLGLGYSF